MKHLNSVQRISVELKLDKNFLESQLDQLIDLAQQSLELKKHRVVYLYIRHDYSTDRYPEVFAGQNYSLYFLMRCQFVKLRLLATLIQSSQAHWVFVSFSDCRDLAFELAMCCHAHIVASNKIALGLSSSKYIPITGAIDKDYFLDASARDLRFRPYTQDMDFVEFIEISFKDDFVSLLIEYENHLIQVRTIRRRHGLLLKLQTSLSQVENIEIQIDQEPHSISAIKARMGSFYGKENGVFTI